MQHICIITTKYPNEVEPTALTFVQQLAWAMADSGEKISVVCPLPLNLNKAYCKIPSVIEEKTNEGNVIRVYFPKCFGLGQKRIAGINIASITTAIFKKIVKRVINGMNEKPDALYGHFITPAGITACSLAREYNVPSYVAYGESTTWSIENIGLERVRKELANVSGIVSVSKKNKEDLSRVNVVDPSKISVFPNGYIPSRFSPKEKIEARKHFGLPEDGFIVSFVGHFIERKGISVLKAAVDSVDDAYLICAGKGELKPVGDNVLYTNLVKPEELAMFYSASDVFVLPTLNEGCCNAIIEAMACGLPIISSNLSFNDDILDETNSIRIDPKDVNAIADAIRTIKDDPELRARLAKGSLEKAKSLTLEKRAENILEFMERMK